MEKKAQFSLLKVSILSTILVVGCSRSNFSPKSAPMIDTAKQSDNVLAIPDKLVDSSPLQQENPQTPTPDIQYPLSSAHSDSDINDSLSDPNNLQQRIRELEQQLNDSQKQNKDLSIKSEDKIRTLEQSLREKKATLLQEKDNNSSLNEDSGQVISALKEDIDRLNAEIQQAKLEQASLVDTGEGTSSLTTDEREEQINILQEKLKEEKGPDLSLSTIRVRIFPIIDKYHKPYSKTSDNHRNQVHFKSKSPLKIIFTDPRFKGTKLEAFHFQNSKTIPQDTQITVSFSKSKDEVTIKYGEQTESHIIDNNTWLWIYPLQQEVFTFVGWKGLKLEASYNSWKSISSIPFRGSFMLHKTGRTRKNQIYKEEASQKITSGLWSVINWVSIEDYMKGVVPSEVYPTWPEPTLRAQAIAARTYGLKKMLDGSGEDNLKKFLWDVTPTTSYQAYRGTLKETEKTSLAVMATEKTIIFYDNKPIEALYHSHSGGHTCNAEFSWSKGSKRGYLKAKKDVLGVAGFGKVKGQFSVVNFNDAREISVTKNAPNSGAVTEVEIITNDNKAFVLTNSELEAFEKKYIENTIGLKKRTAPSGEKHKETYSFYKKDGKIYVRKGFGHCSGMSQWGAFCLGGGDLDICRPPTKQVYSDEEILKYYYGNKIRIGEID